MEHVTIADVVACTNGALLAGNPETVLSGICIDSRAVEPDCLFVPIVGEKVDAHRFLADVLNKGAAASLTSREDTEIPTDGKALIKVSDTLDALHAIGKLCRSRIPVPAVGVTGSVGKTTTREMIATALSAGKKVFRTSKNYNSRIGVPITMSLMNPDDDIAVLELGMNVPGELGSISRLAKLAMAVVTNVGVAHIEFYGTQEKICEEKLTITTGLEPGGIVFLNGDDPLLYAKKDSLDFPVVLYGLQEHNDYRAEDVQVRQKGTTFVMVHGETRIPVTLSVPGAHNVGNALAALAVADHVGVDLVAAAKALEQFGGFQNRLQMYQTGGYTIIDDTYNASPDSMKSGLTVLCDMECSGRRIAVLGDMFELGSRAPEFHYEVGAFAAKKPLTKLYTVGTNAKEIDRAVTDAKATFPVEHFETVEGVIEVLKKELLPGDILYLKASNGMKLKTITAALVEVNQN